MKHPVIVFTISGLIGLFLNSCSDHSDTSLILEDESKVISAEPQSAVETAQPVVAEAKPKPEMDTAVVTPPKPAPTPIVEPTLPPAPPKSDLDLLVEKTHPMPDFALLIDLVENWNNVPERAFPERITINEPLEYKIIQNGVESNHQTASALHPAGHTAKPLKFKPGQLLVTTGSNPNMKAAVDLDKTNFKEAVTKKYDSGIERIKAQVLAAREKMKEQVTRDQEASALTPEPQKHSDDLPVEQKGEEFVTFEFSKDSPHRSGLPEPKQNSGRDVPDRSNGGKKMLAIRAIRENESRDAIKRIYESSSQMKMMYEQLDRYWLFSSYGNLWVDNVTLAPVVTLSSEDGASPEAAIEAARYATANAMGMSSGDDLKEDFDFVTVIFDQEQKMGSVASVNGWKARIGDFKPHILIHELFHNLGQGPHYCAWVPSQGDDPISGPGRYLTKGYPFASLGGFSIENRNKLTEPLQAKQSFRWVSMGSRINDQIQIVKESGLYKIYRHDVNNPGGTLGLLIDQPGSDLGTKGEANQYTQYLLSFVARKTAITQMSENGGNRLVADLEDHIGKGLLVERVAYDRNSETLTETCIIDCNYEKEAKILSNRNAQAAECLSNSFLKVGDTLHDKEAGISIKVISIGGDDQEKYIEVELLLTK